jgi:dihydrofolate synthase / folylpolyglutamate synthase
MHASRDARSRIDERLQTLFERRAAGIRPGLETVSAVLDELQRPERRFAAVHIAGTNGKGSTAAMVESMLRSCGYRTGLFTSPHLVRFHERYRIGGRLISDALLSDVIEAAEAADAAQAAKPGHRRATFFEMSTAIAFEAFARDGVQFGVVETGMGGRWDATNVLRPVLSVLTSIGMDHAATLGDTLEKIAAEKFEIVKEGVPVVSADYPESLMRALEEKARRCGSEWARAAERVRIRVLNQAAEGQKLDVETAEGPWGALRLPLLGRHQVENAALAVCALEMLRDGYGLDAPTDALKAGLESTRWNGRTQWLRRHPDVMVDSAHNPAGAAALCAVLRRLRGTRPIGLVLGFMRDKDARGILDAFQPLTPRLWLTPMPRERSCTAEELRSLAESYHACSSVAPLDVALEEAEAWAASSDGLVCVAGSVYLAGDALVRYGLDEKSDEDGERAVEADGGT